MSVKVRPYRHGSGWEVDIRVELPDGKEVRERKKAPVPSKSGAVRWGQGRERELLLSRPVKPVAEVPMFDKFVERYLRDHARANRLKPSAIATKETILRIHLLPRFGKRRLTEITTDDVQRLKARLTKMSPKTVNNVLSVLNAILRVAVEWEVIPVKPCTIRLLKTSRSDAVFFDFAEFERLLVSARERDPRAYVACLLGGEAGFRVGEMLALEWSDIDFKRQQLLVQRSDWEGQVSLPKGGRPRRLPLTARLLEGLKVHQKSAVGALVLCEDDGSALTRRVLSHMVRKSTRTAGLAHGGIHVLRHTFCSHLAMRAAPARAIQELAGHRDLSTTQQYMHLSPAAVDAAIRLLESPEVRPSFGEILEKQVQLKTG